jgi:hypothetical protein
MGTPDMFAEIGEQFLCLLQIGKVQLNHDVVGVSDWTAYPVREYAGGGPVYRIPVKGRLPGWEVRDVMFDLQGVQRNLLTGSAKSRLLTLPK